MNQVASKSVHKVQRPKKPVRSIRRLLFDALEFDNDTLLSKFLGGLVTLFIVLSVGSLMIDSVEGLSDDIPSLFWWIEVPAACLFLTEYALRLWSITASRKKKFQHPVWGRVRYLISISALIDLGVVLSFLLGHTFQGIIYFRLFQLLKLARHSPAMATIIKVLKRERETWFSILTIIFIFLIFSSTVMWRLESKVQPDVFANIPQAMWWGITTLTTIGYGDVVPITPMGKLFGGFVQVIGVSMYSLHAALLASSFMQEFNRRELSVTFTMISSVPIFSRLTSREVSAIAELMKPETLPARYAVLRPEEQVQALYILYEGEAELEEQNGTFTRIERGDFFGLAALSPYLKQRARSVTTLTECTFLVLERDEFEGLLEEMPDLERDFQKALFPSVDENMG